MLSAKLAELSGQKINFLPSWQKVVRGKNIFLPIWQKVRLKEKMEKGIVCKVWNIKGTTDAKGAIDQLRDSVGYILNDEKTTASGKLDPLNQLTRECKYIENDLKTFEGAYIGGNNISSCDVSSAVAEMMEIKRFYGKEDGRAALHMVISLPEDESSPTNATKLMQLCDSVVKEVFTNNQAVYAVHTNTENLHIHVIVNSVGLDGKKIHQNSRFMRDVLHPCVNKYAAVYGFTQNPKWKTASQNNLSFPEIKMMLRTEIDRAIEVSESFDDFMDALKKNGISVRVGKHISLISDGMGKAVRTNNLGQNYTKDAIVERILTRKDKFIRFPEQQTVFVRESVQENIPYTFKLPRYQDMSKEEKKKAIHELRLGKNPWRENRLLNWQLNNIADELNSVQRIRAYVDYYSPNGSVQDALKGMIETKKRIVYDKKLIQEAKRRYKPILDIYKEMKAIEKRAYLYEYENYTEYRTEHEQYRILTKRLKDGYNKEVFEIDSFLRECEERYIYDQASLNEVSLEYRELKKYAEKRGIVANLETSSLIDILGYYSDDKKNGIYEANGYFIASPESNIVIKVIKYPAMDEKGRLIEKYELAVMDRFGHVLSEFSNSDGGRDFIEQVKNIQRQYNLDECRKFNNFKLASEYCKAAPADTTEPVKPVNGEKKPELTFTQAVNHVTEEKPVMVITSMKNPRFVALSSREQDHIKLVVFDQNLKSMEVANLPLVKKRNSDGFLKLSGIMEKYGFTEEVREFENLDDARKYCEEEKENKRRTKEKTL